MSFDGHTFSKVSPKHMERVQHIIVVMGCYINSTGVRLHDVYKLNTNTERKVTITHLFVSVLQKKAHAQIVSLFL